MQIISLLAILTRQSWIYSTRLRCETFFSSSSSRSWYFLWQAWHLGGLFSESPTNTGIILTAKHLWVTLSTARTTIPNSPWPSFSWNSHRSEARAEMISFSWNITVFIFRSVLVGCWWSLYSLNSLWQRAYSTLQTIDFAFYIGSTSCIFRFVSHYCLRRTLRLFH